MAGSFRRFPHMYTVRICFCINTIESRSEALDDPN